MADLTPFGVRPETWEDGRTRLIGKDDAGRDYVAHTCAGVEVTDADVQDLAESDREHNTAHELVAREVARNEKRKADALIPAEEFEEAAAPVVRAGFHGFWGTGYGLGEVNPSQPRRTRYRWNDQTRQLELVEERLY